jgi:hypothetical protein
VSRERLTTAAPTNDQQLTTIPKKLLQYFCRASRQHSTPYFHLMIQSRVIHHLQNRMDGPCLRIVGTVYQAADARMNCRSRAHGARLNCSKQFAVAQTVVTDVSSRLAQGHNLGMRRWIVVGEIAIPSSSHQPTGTHHDCSDWHFARFQRALRTAEGFFHPQLVRGIPVGGARVGRRLARRWLLRENLVGRMFVREEQF